MTNVTPFPDPDDDGGRSAAERAVFARLDRLSCTVDGFSWVGNAGMNVRGFRRELDALANYRGHSFGIEVDGPHHARKGRYVADRSKDLLLEDGGLLFVRRIAVEDTNEPPDVDAFLASCLSRLNWWRRGAA